MTNKTMRTASCPAELTCAMHADGELFGSEALEFEDHLKTCPRCRDQVQAFQTERNALVGAMGNAGAFVGDCVPVHSFSPSPIHAMKLMGWVTGFAAVLWLGLSSILDLELPWSTEWLNPLEVSGQLSLLFSSAAYLTQEGGSIMSSLINNIGFTTLAVSLLYTLFVLMRRPLGVSTAVYSLGLLLVAGFSTQAEAIDIRSRDIVSIEADEIIDDTLVASGRTVRIDGEVTGDVIAFAQSIDIRGTVRGDVYTFGQNIEIDGEVGGGITGFGQVIRVGDSVGQSVIWFGQSILTRRDASIGGDLFAFGEDINIGGAVGRNVTVFGNTLTISGEVMRDVTFSGSLAAVHSSASIGGNFNVDLPAEENLEVDSAATVTGVMQVDIPESSEDESLSAGSFVLMALWLAAAFVSGMILFWSFPSLGRMHLVDLRAILVSTGTGFIILIAMPVAAAVLAVTLIGLPVGLVTAAAWALGLYVSKIVVANYLGTALLRPKKSDLKSMTLPLLAGLVLVLVVVSLPYIGWIINLLLVILGLGAMGQVLYRNYKSRAVAA